ncbi:MAG TPA: hypothetical protein VFU53_01970 [Burkholderiales bacterium]|nr:hypothetical protein [Burkholderiales bacterium]
MEMDTRNQASNPMGSTLEEASARAGAASGRLQARAHEAVDQVASAMHGATDRLGARSEEWIARQDEMVQQVRGYVRERPVMSLAIAAAVGFVLSRLMR